MSTHEAPYNDRLDLGERVVIAVTMIVLGVAVVMTIVSAALNFYLTMLVQGVVYCIAPVWLTNQLYQGRRTALKVIFYWTALQVVLTLLLFGLLFGARRQLTNFGLPGAVGTVLFIIQCLAQLTYGLTILSNRNAQRFLAFKRGEPVPEAPASAEAVRGEDEPYFAVSTESGVKEVVLVEPAKQALSELGLVLYGVAAVLLIVAGVGVIGGVRALFVGSGSWVLLIPVGVLAGLLGLILVTLSADLSYLRTTKGSETAHLTNALTTLKDFFNLQLTAVCFVALVVVLRLLFR